MKKRVFAVLTALFLLCACLPLGAVNVSAAETSGTTGDCTWTLDGTHLTISGNGEMWDYSSKYTKGEFRTTAPWGWNITSVTIEDGVTTIGECAFYRCKSLKSVTIPDSVTTIRDSAFFDCTSLQLVTIGNSVTTIRERAFKGCGCLRAVTIPDSVTTIRDEAFDECDDLQSVYYTGTEEDYANMVIEDDNSYLLDATWHYNHNVPQPSDKQNTDEDNNPLVIIGIVIAVLLAVVVVLLFLLLKKKKSE